MTFSSHSHRCACGNAWTCRGECDGQYAPCATCYGASEYPAFTRGVLVDRVV